MYTPLFLISTFLVLFTPSYGAYEVTTTASFVIQDYLDDPSKTYFSDPFPVDQEPKFQLQVNEDGPRGTFFGIRAIAPDSPDWAGMSMGYDCSLVDYYGYWKSPLGKAEVQDERVVALAGSTHLKWKQLWGIRNALSSYNRLVFKCEVKLNVK